MFRNGSEINLKTKTKTKKLKSVDVNPETEKEGWRSWTNVKLTMCFGDCCCKIRKVHLNLFSCSLVTIKKQQN